MKGLRAPHSPHECSVGLCQVGRPASQVIAVCDLAVFRDSYSCSCIDHQARTWLLVGGQADGVFVIGH